MECSVIVPTLRRPRQLLTCLEGIAEQSRKPIETVVVRRRDDEETASLLAGVLPVPVKEVVVDGGGQTGALAAGTHAAQGDVVAITDDDAVPRSEWIEGLLRLYDLPGVGGAGGRDRVQGGDTSRTSDVGRIVEWSGKLVGNHSRGSGGPREVAVLKGVNCSYRRDVVEFPVNLRGAGSQIGWEWATGFRTREKGWRLVYDSEVVVDHYPGPRFDSDQRVRPSPDAVANVAFNEALILGSFHPTLLCRRLAYGIVVGTAGTPGFARMAKARLDPVEWRRVGSRWRPSMRGFYAATWLILRGERVRFITPARGSPT